MWGRKEREVSAAKVQEALDRSHDLIDEAASAVKEVDQLHNELLEQYEQANGEDSWR